MVRVELAYGGSRFFVLDPFADIGEDGAWPYIWTDGNYSCDCNRSLFIRQQITLDVPELGCGDTIALIGVE